MRSLLFSLIFFTVLWAALNSLGWAREWEFYPAAAFTLFLAYLLHKGRQLPKRS